MNKGYVGGLLGEGESVALVAHPHTIVYYQSVIRPTFVLILGLILIGVWSWGLSKMLPGPEVVQVAVPWVGLALTILAALVMFYRYLAWRSTQYIITSRRVIQLRGILSKHVFDSSLDFINDLRLQQSIIGRILGYGDVEILTASDESGDVRQTYRYVARPTAFLRALEAQRERRRQGGALNSGGPLGQGVR